MMSMNAKGVLLVQKAAVRAYTFNKGRIPCPPDTLAVAVHTRFATQGDKGFMRNNHPVMSGEAFVIHNGVIDDSGVRRMQGHPEVDTFALAVKAATARERLEGESARQHALRVALTMAELEGSAAVLAAFQGTPMLLAARLTSSPLFWTESNGVRITASTRKAVEKAADGLGFDTPTETLVVKKTIKRKKGEPDTTEESEAVFERIDHADEGQVLVWTPGGHTKGKIEMPERSAQPKSWRRYLTTGDTGESDYTTYQQGFHSTSNKGSAYLGWGQLKSTVEAKDPDDKEVTVTTRTYQHGHKSVTRYRGGQFLSSTTHPPEEPSRTVTALTPSTGQGRELYPVGTPWPPDGEEGKTFAAHFKLWRLSSHGKKWARMHPLKAKAYDDATERRKRNNLTPPFPAPVEVEAMLADPLFERVEDGFTVIGDVSTLGVQSVKQDVLDKAVQRMLGRASTAQDARKVCDVCNEHSSQFRDTPDGEMCEDCERLWMWSEYQAR